MTAVPTGRAGLDRIAAFVPARTTESVRRQFGVSRVVKLAGNENCLGCSPLVRQAIAEAVEGLAEYPDVACTMLAEKLAATHGVPTGRLVLDNGLFSLVAVLAQAFLDPGDEAVIPEPTFGWYRIATLAAGGNPVSVPLAAHRIALDDVRRRIGERTRLVWLCNPNNPTGTAFGGGALRRFLKAAPAGVAVVLDEAYGDFAEATDFPRALELLADHPNLIVLRTFSKLHGLAGLRVGYGIMDPAIVERINRIRAPVNVNTLAQVAAGAALDDRAFQVRGLAHVRAEKRFYYEACAELGLTAIPSETNFVMIDTGIDSDIVVDHLLRQGILIRGGKDFGLPNHVRITVGTREDNLAVVSHLRDILSKHGAR